MSNFPTFCDLCGDAKSELVHNFGHWRLISCVGCGLRWGIPKPLAEEIGKLYDNEYFRSSNPRKKGYSNYQSEEKMRVRTFMSRFNTIQDFMSPGTCLDIGCAYGYSIQAATTNGWQCEGIDISSHCCGVANERGYAAHQGDFLQFESGNKYDLITAWDVIEHTSSPKVFLFQVSKHLRQGGVVALTTPDAGSFLARFWGKRWHEYKWPAHLYYFSRPTLEQYCSEVGFKVIYIGFSRKYRSLANSLARWLGFYEFSPAISTIPVLNKEIYYSSLSEMYLIAKKI